jgi:hypothetical protein
MDQKAYCGNYQSGYTAGWQVTQGVSVETKEQQGYWTLTVSLRGVPTDLSIYVQAIGQSGHTVGASPSGMSVVTLQMPQNEFPRGESYTIGIWKPGGLGSWQQFIFLSAGQDQMYTYDYMTGHMYQTPSYVERS